LKEKVEAVAVAGMEEVVTIADKMDRSSRYSRLKKEVLAQIDPAMYEAPAQVTDLLSDYKKTCDA
jgi:polyribonucleotide nucleotidyltransferase